MYLYGAGRTRCPNREVSLCISIGCPYREVYFIPEFLLTLYLSLSSPQECPGGDVQRCQSTVAGARPRTLREGTAEVSSTQTHRVT